MFLILALFLLYYWYFYYFRLKPLPTPTSALPPKLDPFHVSFHSVKHDMFRIHLNSTIIWEHVFQDPSYHVHGPSSSIIERDACYHYIPQTNIVAKGVDLYKYLKQNPHYNPIGNFEEHSPYAAKQKGDIFFFTCLDRRIVNLNVCPSGEIFQNQRCVAVSNCTDKPNGTKLVYFPNKSKYILCNNGRESVHSCPPYTQLFYHDKCIAENDLIYQCKLHDTLLPIKVDDETFFECRNGQPYYTKCAPGTKLFENDICEPVDCVGKSDHEKVPFSLSSWDPFHYTTGYVECLHEKISKTIECSETWDESLSHGDNLTMLPMVFDGEKCAVPEFCVNVFSNDPDTLVPLHEFTKDVKNWTLSEHLDRSVGYLCTPHGRKRKILEPDQRISKQFRVEPACQPGILLPIYNEPNQYYDCTLQQMNYCNGDEYFDGKACQKDPNNVFRYNGIPFFNFNSLNLESWMYALETHHKKGFQRHDQCKSSEFVYVSPYDVCSHTDCLHYTFLTMIPQFSILLPRPEESKCIFDPSDRHIRKEKVFFGYTFWNQQRLSERVNRADDCTFGQKIKTGHFVWDSTVYATCDINQPFVFCPSVHTTQLMAEKGVYACAPPPTSTYTLEKVNEYIEFSKNEIKRLIPREPDTYYLINRSVNQPEPLDVPEFIHPGMRVALNTNKSIDLELRYRITHPLNVVFKYDDQNQMEMLSFQNNEIFHMRKENINNFPFNLPTYEPETHVDSFALQP